MKKALITGVTGQDGAYLVELLLGKGYEVHGLVRRTSLPTTGRIAGLLQESERLILHSGDLTDQSSLMRIIGRIQPDEIYNLGAQSDVAASFDEPEHTAQVDALGPLRILESLRLLDLGRKTRFYQASTSEIFGETFIGPRNEASALQPCSPYGCAKLYAHCIVVTYRKAYGFYACNGILFNHESPMRGMDFVSRKITRGLSRVKAGLEKNIFVGNLDARRDWGHAKDYVEMQWLMLQQPKPDDYVIATGLDFSVREFVETAGCGLGMKIQWRGKGRNEVGYDEATGNIVVVVDAKYFRPVDIPRLVGDAAKARERLGWKPRIKFESMVSEMVRSDWQMVSREMDPSENKRCQVVPGF